MTVEKRVAQGAALLDRKRPGWENEVDLSILNIGSDSNCILGQLWGFVEGAAVLDLPLGAAPDSVEHGFMFLSQVPHDDDIVPLNAEWKRVIIERRILA